jgi:outer membrane murein-binding lipoprotein Lpp
MKNSKFAIELKEVNMKAILSGLVISTLLIASCSKSDSNNNNIKIDTTSSHLGTLVVDIDGIPTAFDSILECTYFTRPNSINDVVITGYEKNDTSRSNIQLMITGSGTILSGTYIDSVPNLNTKYGFQFTYGPPNLPISFYGDQSGITRPEIQIYFTQDSIQGTFAGRLINVGYPLNLPPVTISHVFTNGKFHLKITHTVGGP